MDRRCELHHAPGDNATLLNEPELQNTLEDLHNLMLATGTDQYAAVANASFIGRSALNRATNWDALLGSSNDDSGAGRALSRR